VQMKPAVQYYYPLPILILYADHIQKLLTDHKLPHPNMVVYPYQS